LGNSAVSTDLYKEVAKYGARDMEICMQCGNCSAACPLSTGTNTFPRRIYRYLQLGLKDKLLSSPEPWLCYYCGECNKDCPRGAEPAETMMATRRWLIAQYDWTGLAKRFYLSPVWEVGAFLLIALGIILLFYFGHGPIVTDRVALNVFAPVSWVKFGDKCMLSILGALLFSNGFRMYRGIMGDVKPPIHLYIKEAWTFPLHYFTQKRLRDCGAERSYRWLKHLLLFSGYVTMEVLVVAFLGSFQTDKIHPMWHPTRVFGYYATVVLMIISADMMISRYKKKEDLHRYSDFTDWFFLMLLFLTALSGIFVHFFRLAGWPLMTYFTYVVHLAIAVGMLCIMLPFGKLSHLFYRPLAIFLTTVKEKATKESEVDFGTVTKDIGDNFMSCMQCGICSGVCPWSRITYYSPRQILRNISLEICTQETVDIAVWDCATCGNCVEHCPRGIEIIDLVRSIRNQNVTAGKLPKYFKAPVQSLEKEGNPWNGKRKNRLDWSGDIDMPAFSPDNEYYLFTCCTTAYDTSPSKGCQQAGQALLKLLKYANVSFGTLGTKENCCGDLADKIGAQETFLDLAEKNTEMFLNAGVKKVLTFSPHCLNAFTKTYEKLKHVVASEHYTQLLKRLLDEERIKPINNVDLKVTFHDPCYLGRHNGIYDEPRKVLQSIPGLTLVEMHSNRERSLCCGGGGGGAWSVYSSGQSFGVLRIREALNIGAEVIATACPYCIRMLNDAVRTLGVEDKIAVRDVAELLFQTVTIQDEVKMLEPADVGVNGEVCHV